MASIHFLQKERTFRRGGPTTTHRIRLPLRWKKRGRRLAVPPIRLGRLENSYYEPQTGQLLTASFMDYAMPRADTLPFLDTALSEVPTPTNRLGVRSGGEGGTTPALAAVINAIVDALADLGVRHIEMPATAERVWHALRAAAARRM